MGQADSPGTNLVQYVWGWVGLGWDVKWIKDEVGWWETQKHLVDCR